MVLIQIISIMCYCSSYKMGFTLEYSLHYETRIVSPQGNSNWLSFILHVLNRMMNQQGSF